jgi:hypothetical protein
MSAFPLALALHTAGPPQACRGETDLTGFAALSPFT